jgi:NDP-hexose-3-ketoreductase
MTMEEPALRFGVLGCGDIAWRNMVPAMERAGVRAVAFASRDPAKAERFAARFGGDAVTGYDRLLDRDDLDAVYIALPTGLHHAWARRTLETGRHALAEKPLTATTAEAEDLVALAAGRGLWLADNFLFPHHSQHTAVRTMLADGLVGAPAKFSAAFGIPARPADDVRMRADLGGGALLDLGVYTVRAARLLFGEDAEVAGATLRVDAASGVDLAGAALLTYPDGRSAELSFGFGLSYRSAYSVWGSSGRITVDRAFTPPPAFGPTVVLEQQNTVRTTTLPPDDQFANLLRAFAGAVRDKADFAEAGAGLLRQARLVDAIRDAAVRRTG